MKATICQFHVCFDGTEKNVENDLSHALDLGVFCVEVLIKFRQLIQVPPLFAETFTWIPKLHWWGPTATTHGPKPWPEREGSSSKGEGKQQANRLQHYLQQSLYCVNWTYLQTSSQ